MGVSKMSPRDSFLDLIPVSDRATKIFFGRLRALAPHLPIDDASADRHGPQLARALALGLESIEREGAAERFGRRLGYLAAKQGVLPDSYESILESILWTVKLMLGDRYTQELDSYWRASVEELLRCMRAGAFGLPRVSIV